MLLSILICSLQEREHLLKRLLNLLEKQKNPDTEILYHVDNGQITVGRKRNNLLDQARGRYIAFVDDDDRVSDDYVKRICDAIAQSPDCVGFEGAVYRDGQPWRRLFQSKQFKIWNQRHGEMRRMPNHLNPVKAALAKKVRFADVSVGEDRDYSVRLYPLLKTEVCLGSPAIYYYDFSTTQSTSAPADAGRYANAFGGDFVLDLLMIKSGVKEIEFKLDGTIHRLAGNNHLQLWRSDQRIELSSDAASATLTTGQVTRFELLTPTAVLPPVSCVVGGQLLRYPGKRSQ